MNFPEILKELREEKNVTRTTVALNCNVSTQCISSLEMGTRNPTSSTLMALANYFNCSIDYLMGREDDFGNITIKTEKPTDFSADELNLIKQYRLLQTGYQTLIAKQIDFLLEQQKASHYVPEDSQTKYKKKNG